MASGGKPSPDQALEVHSRNSRPSLDTGRRIRQSFENVPRKMHSRPSLDMNSASGGRGQPAHAAASPVPGRQSLDWGAAYHRTSGKRNSMDARGGSNSGRDATDLDRLAHMVQLITKGRPLDIVISDLKDKKRQSVKGSYQTSSFEARCSNSGSIAAA